MHRVPDFTYRDFRNPQQSFVPQEVGLNPGNSLTENVWPAIHNNLTSHHYFPVSDVPSAPLSSYWWRATVTWEELQHQQQGPTAHSPETRYRWRHSSPAVQGTSKISTGFCLRPPPHHKLKPFAWTKENQSIPPRIYMKCTKERHSSSAKMTAEIKDLLHLFFLSRTTGALFEGLHKGIHAPCLDCCHTWACKSPTIKQQRTTLLRLQTCPVSPLDQHTITTSQAFSQRSPRPEATAQ